ncbi:substrate-binding domain-containing protein [Bacillota bacterium LX-D]|nr:substrate-binding domain-containing protein [Bacillota bacterium LX-D]
MRVKLKILIICTLICLLILPGCRRTPAQKPASSPSTVIGVSVTYEDKDFKARLKKAFQQNAKEDQLKIIWQESKVEKQEQDVKKLLEQKIKVLVIQFGNEEKAEEIVRLAKERNIAILALGFMPMDLPLDGFIGVDAYRTGQQQAVYLNKALAAQKPAKVLIVDNTASSWENELTRGNIEGLQAEGGFQAIRQSIDPGEKVAEKLRNNQSLSEVKGIILHNPLWTKDLIELLEELNLEKNIVTVGLGASKDSAQAILQDTHEAEIDIDPQLLGRYAYGAARDLAKEGQWHFERRITSSSGTYEIPVQYLPANIITKDNLFLLENRYKGLKENPKDTGANAENSQNSNSKQQNSDKQNSDGNKSKSKVTIKTKNGKNLEINVDGEVERVEIQDGSQQKDQQEEEKE